MLLVFFFFFSLFCGHASSSSSQLDAFIELRESQVKDLCTEVALYHNSFKIEGYDPETCVFYDGCDSALHAQIPDLECSVSDDFGKDDSCGTCSYSEVSMTVATTKFAPGVDRQNEDMKEFLCFTENLRQTFRQNQIQDPNVTWQYVASEYGAICRFPGTSWRFIVNPLTQCREHQSSCPDYDPRLQSWYIGAASGPKNVVLVIDKSGSMGGNSRTTRWNVALEAAKTVVEGLSFRDRLGIVFFDTVPRSCPGIGYTLLSADERNRALFRSCITDDEEFNPGGDTDFYQAFDKAFEVLESASSSSSSNDNCHNNVILFLTDGTNTGSNPLSLISSRNTPEIDARIFTFGLSDDSDLSLPQEIACQNKGIFTYVEEGEGESGDLRTKMASYYQYFSYQNPSSSSSSIDDDDDDSSLLWWSIAEEDLVAGLGNKTTVSQACFSSTGRLIAVAAIDVPIHQFAMKDPIGFDGKLKELQSRGQRSCQLPNEFNIPEELLIELRMASSKDGLTDYCLSHTAMIVGSVLGSIGAICLCIIVLVACALSFHLGLCSKIKESCLRAKERREERRRERTETERKMQELERRERELEERERAMEEQQAAMDLSKGGGIDYHAPSAPPIEFIDYTL